MNTINNEDQEQAKWALSYINYCVGEGVDPDQFDNMSLKEKIAWAEYNADRSDAWAEAMRKNEGGED